MLGARADWVRRCTKLRAAWSALIAGAFAAASAGCSSAPPNVGSREVCVIRTEADMGLPRLYRRANAGTQNLGPAPNVCGVPANERKMADRCEEVDDLSALLGTGKVCGPSGVGSQLVCPRYAEGRVRQEPPALTKPPCEGACDNVQIAITESSGSVTRVVFYDDPACHTTADPACPDTGHRCYYRVLALTSELR